MPATPVDDHTQEFEELAGLSAFDALESDERARFDAHAARCERCQLMVRLDRRTLAELANTAPEMEPSPGFKTRLMQRAAEELAAVPATTEELTAASATAEDRAAASATAEAEAESARRGPTPLRTPSNVIPLWRRRSWLSALAAVLVAGLVTAGAFTYQNQVVHSYALSGSLAGSASVQLRRSGAAELQLRGLADPGAGFVYEAWVIPPGGQPIPAGTTTSGDAQLPLPEVGAGTTVAITKERARVDVPTPPILMATVVQL